MGSVESGLNDVGGLQRATAITETTTRAEATTTIDLNLPKKCFYEFITFTTFSISLFAGLTLMTASLFKEQVNYEEIGKLQFNFNLAVLLGLLVTMYSVVGFILNCLNKLPGKVRANNTHFD